MVKKKAAVIAALCGVLGFGALAPASATSSGAMEASPELGGGAVASATGECTGSWVTVSAGTSLWARSTPDATSTTNKMWEITGFKAYPCRRLVIGGAHKACGRHDVNGWIVIQDYAFRYNGQVGWSGYIPSVCTTDGV